MNILKYAFWGFIIILLLPATNDEKQAIYGGMKKIGWDFVSFCDRNPEVCNGVKDAVSALVQKLNLGAEMVSDAMDPSLQPAVTDTPVADDPAAAGYTDEPGRYPLPAIKPAVYQLQDTLTEEDLRPDWQGPRT
jgi:hypothetical protein